MSGRPSWSGRFHAEKNLSRPLLGAGQAVSRMVVPSGRGLCWVFTLKALRHSSAVDFALNKFRILKPMKMSWQSHYFWVIFVSQTTRTRLITL